MTLFLHDDAVLVQIDKKSLHCAASQQSRYFEKTKICRFDVHCDVLRNLCFLESFDLRYGNEWKTVEKYIRKSIKLHRGLLNNQQ